MKRFRILVECDVELDADDIFPCGVPPDAEEVAR